MEENKWFQKLLDNKKIAEQKFNEATELPMIDLAIAELKAIDYQIDKFIAKKKGFK